MPTRARAHTTSTRPTDGRRQTGGATRARRAPRQRRTIGLLIGGVIVAVAALYGISRLGGTNTASGMYEIGQPGPGALAPSIQLPTTAGTTFDLGGQRGKTVLLYFNEGIGCQGCWDQLRDIEKDFGPFRAAGIDEVVAVAANPASLLARKAADDGITSTVAADVKLALGPTYHANNYGMMGTSAYGHTFIVVGPDGRIRWRADYGGKPNYIMYVKPTALLNDLQSGLASNGPGQ